MNKVCENRDYFEHDKRLSVSCSCGRQTDYMIDRYCHRYPKKEEIIHKDKHWCGEFKPKEA